MALRAFHENPSIGGFGNENSATLVLGNPKENNPPSNDTTTFKADGNLPVGGDALCQIIKELVDNAVDACETARKADGRASYRVRVEISPYNGSDDFLQVTVSDNGCGMEDIHKCVNAFQSSKGSGNEMTTGRYGLGLTLSIVHSQRLVPGRVYCCITSATKQAPHFRRQHYFVDTTQDKMQCERDETVPKAATEVSGTCVSLLVPVSARWERSNLAATSPSYASVLKRQGGATAANAWNRIVIYLKRFHLSPTRCSIEVLAPTLAQLPIVVRSHTDGSQVDSTLSQDFSEALQEGFDSDEDATDENAAVTKVKNAFLEQRKALQLSAQKYGYFHVPLKLCNIAHAENIIQQPGQIVGNSDPSKASPKIKVDIIVSPNEETTEFKDCDGTVACMELVRMVNSVPLLDGVESIACGLVRAAKNSVFWSSFGLTVFGGTESDEDTWINRFMVRDCDQVAPFFRTSTHDLWHGNKDNEVKQDDANALEGKKRKHKAVKAMLPAKVRLGRILVVVDVQAEPNVIPMPSLTKGRLPVNHGPIAQAFHLGIRDCLRNLQVTSPGLFLSAAQLRSVERDVRYVPLLARASANMLNRLHNQSHQERAFALLRQIQDVQISGGSIAPLGLSDIVRIIEHKSRQSVTEAEGAKKQSKRSKSARKADGSATAGYEDIDSVSHDTTETPIQAKPLSSQPDQRSISEQSWSQSPKKPRDGPPSHIDLIVGDIESHEYDDDGDWW
jgi:Histidine kinase-, DNA gyrase B-, and HSP90-like ATPase